MTRNSDPPDSKDTRARVIENTERLGLLDMDVGEEPSRSRRFAQILEQLPDHVIADLDAQLTRHADPVGSLVDDFAEAHGITEAEQKLLTALARGQSVGQHAEELGISINTARTHMRRLLEKTGSQNQVDLVRKLLG